MSIQISPEIEANLTDEASRMGISVNTLLERLIDKSQATVRLAEARPELPAWELGAVGSLNRRDIYDDAR